MMRFAEIDEAQTLSGMRLVMAGHLPSPWSQAAMGILDMKGIDYVAVRLRTAPDKVRAWTGSHNAPVAIYNHEPPRTGWAEILTLAERLGGAESLIPTDPDLRVKLFGLGNEILGEDGLAWNVRLLLVHASFASDGKQGWPSPVASMLAPKYGYAAERATHFKQRAIAVLNLLTRTLEASRARQHEYFLGDKPSALDIYAAVALAVVAPLPPEQCPTLPVLRQAFLSLDADVRAAASSTLLNHRDLMFARHLVLPVRF